MNRLAQMCSVAEHSRQEMVEKAIEWGVDPADAQSIADRLVSERFVDDNRFAPIFVRDKARFSGWGPVKIRMALLQKGVDENVADDAIDAFPKDEWHKLLMKALASKIRTTHQDDPQKLLASTVRFGLQRGFAYDEIRKAINDLQSLDVND